MPTCSTPSTSLHTSAICRSTSVRGATNVSSPTIVSTAGTGSAALSTLPFGVNGNASLVLSVALGFVLSGVVYAVQGGLIPEAAAPWINLVIVALSGGLGAAGLYDLGKKWSGKD